MPVATVRDQARAGISKHMDKVLFAVCALGGLLAIIAVDLAEGSKWIAVGLCVMLMVAYGLAALLVPGLRLRPDQAADNIYYLGLLDTLTSLGVALIRFTSSEQATDAILRNFGIAIFTTIVGLGGRVFVGQFREDPEDIEAEAKAALSETVHQMRQQLDLSVAELRSFADGMRQVVNEFTERANTSTVETLEKAVGQFERSAQSMGARFESSAELFSGHVQAFDSSLEHVVSAVEGLMDRIGAVRADADILERGLRPALDVVERTVAEFASVVGREQGRFEEGATAVARFSQAAGGLGEAGLAIGSAADDIRRAGGALGQVAELVARLEAASTTAADATGRFASSLDEVAKRAEARGEQGFEALHRAADAAARNASDEAQARMVALEAAARRVIETLKGLESEFTGSGDAIIQVRRELAELAGWIIARLEK